MKNVQTGAILATCILQEGMNASTLRRGRRGVHPPTHDRLYGLRVAPTPLFLHATYLQSVTQLLLAPPRIQCCLRCGGERNWAFDVPVAVLQLGSDDLHPHPGGDGCNLDPGGRQISSRCQFWASLFVIVSRRPDTLG